MKVTRLTENYFAAFGLIAAVAIAFFAIGITAAHAEEEGSVETTEVDKSNKGGDKRAQMIEQIESLKSIIAAKKEALSENRESFKEQQAETREEYKQMKEEVKLDKAAFLAGLEGLSEEEVKAEMKAFIEKIKEVIQARKLEMENNREEFKQIQAETRNEYRETQKDLLGNNDKVKSILDRIEELKSKLKQKLEDDSTDDEEVEDESGDDEEVEDDSTDETEDEDTEDETDDEDTEEETQS